MGGLALMGGAVKLALVMGLLFVTLRLVGRVNGRTGSRPGDPVRVVSRSALGRRASLVVVRVGARQLVLGVTEQCVNVVTEVAAAGDPEEEAAPAGTPAAGEHPSWRELLETVRERTVRR